TMRGQATDLGTNWFLTRNLNFGREYLEKVQKITLDDIKRVAIQCLSEENLTIVSLNPKGSLTSTSDVAAAAATGEIQKFELSNGLRILVREDARLPLIAMSAIFRCGLLCETEANNGITRLAAKTKDEDEKPTSVARNLVKRALFPGHPLGLRPEGTPKSVSGLNSKDLLAFRDRYVVAQNGVIAVFGDVKATEVRDLFEQKLGA